MKLSFFKIGLVAIIAAFAVSSCKTVNVEALKKTKKVALISVMGRHYIDPASEGGLSIAAIVSTAVQGKKLDGKVTTRSMVRLLNKNVAKLPFKMVNPKYFLNKRAYKNLKSPLLKNIAAAWAPRGYKAFADSETEKIITAIKAAKADAGMMVSYEPKLINAAAPFTAKLGGVMVIKIVDKKGEVIVRSLLNETSDTVTASVMGVFNAKPIPKMAKEALTKNLKEFERFVKGEMAKAKK